MAALSLGRQAMWLGGSDISYNYDGLAYTNNAPVAPLSRIAIFDIPSQSMFTGSDSIFPVMDLRGIAQISPTQFIIAGGMTTGPEVSRETMLLTFTNPFQTGLETLSRGDVNIRQDDSLLIVESNDPTPISYRLIDLRGKIILNGISPGKRFELNTTQLGKAMHVLHIKNLHYEAVYKIIIR